MSDRRFPPFPHLNLGMLRAKMTGVVAMDGCGQGLRRRGFEEDGQGHGAVRHRQEYHGA